MKSKFEQEISSTKRSWNKRWEQNLENIEKIEKEHKNKKLVTVFTEKSLTTSNTGPTKALEKYEMSKFYTITISNNEFKIEYDLHKYQEERILDGKYVIESNVLKEDMNTKQVRGKYKELQNVEHAFRHMKTDKLNIKLSYHDITDELNNINVSELVIGHCVKKIRVLKISDIQSEMIRLFNPKIEDIMRV